MGDMRQLEFYAWGLRTFGLHGVQPREKALRFIEEAVELAQAAGLEARDIYLILNRCYLRPKGDLAKEIGQVQLVLEGLSEAHGISASEAADKEFKRVLSFSTEYWRERQNIKADAGLGERV